MSKSNEKLVQNTLKILERDFIVVGKTRVRSWHAWLAIGIATGILVGVLFVANRSGEFEKSSAQVAPTSGLVAHWKLDEGAGTTATDSAGTNNGTLINGPTFTTGKIGQGLSFDGINDAVQIPDSNSLDVPQITVSAWVRKIYNAPSWAMIVSRQAGTGTGDNWILFYNSSANDEYRFIAQGGTNLKLYRNGVQISDNVVSSNNDIGQWVHIVGTAEGAIPSETSAVCIGGGANGVSRNCDSEYSNAVIDDARIYNRALSAQEVLDIYNSAGVVTSTPTPTPTATTGTGALLQKSNLVYEGAFKVPHGTIGDSTFEYGGPALAYNPANKSLFVAGHNTQNKVAEISIPTVTNNDLTQLSTATALQPFTDPTEGGLNNLPTTGSKKVGGLMVYQGKLYETGYLYYDGSNVQIESHFVSGLNLSIQGDVQGPFAVGNLKAGFVSGWMIPIPTAYQSALGGPAITGNCCLGIITRTSYGPSAFAFNPSDLGKINPVPDVPLLYYSKDHTTLGPWGGSTPYYSGSDSIRGVAFPEGARSVLYFGTHGTTFCYGAGTSDPALHGKPTPDGTTYCYDPSDGSKGTHGYPYEYQIWAYDVNDLIAAKNGQKNPWDILPYGVWNFTLPFQSSGRQLGGVAYDPGTQRIFLAQSYGDARYPAIHVFKVQAGTTVTPTPTPTPPADTTFPSVSISSPSSGTTVSGTTNINATASDNVGVTKVEFYVDGVLKSTDTTSPYSYSWDTPNGGAHVCNGAHTHSLTAKAYDAAGNPRTSDAITVNMNNPAYCTTAVNIAANPASITSGSSSTLTWSSTNANSCTASGGWSGTKATSGTQAVSPTATTTYTLSCTGSGGTASQSTTVTVNLPVSTSSLSAKQTLSAIALDGSLSESAWASANSVSFSNPAQSNNMVTVKALWDSNNLYFAYDVTDSQLEALGDSYVFDDDGAEIYLDIANNKSTAMDQNDWHIGTNINNAITLYKQDATLVLGASVSTQRLMGGYTQEIAIPWSLIGTTPQANKVIGLLLANNDRDNGIIKQFDWMNVIATGNYAQPNLWGDLILSSVNLSDANMPLISNAAASSITSSSATITWTTNEMSTHQVDYGTTAAYGSSTAENMDMMASHSQTLSGLQANTLYHYRVKSRDAAGLITSSQDFTFTTLQLLDTIPPARSNGQPTGTLAVGTATLSLTTNEAATCRYSTIPNTPYSSMPNIFTNTGGMMHSTAISGLVNGNSYVYYVKCIDAAGNANTN